MCLGLSGDSAGGATYMSETLRLRPLPNRGGRPSKFTAETRARLVQLAAKGVPFKHCCLACRITFQSFNTYREQHPDFRQELEEAIASAIERRLDVIQKA